jgi:tetratricopeptide (TPR) repeat protein
LADLGSDGVPPELLEHLAACPVCMAAWSAAVEQRHHDLAAAPERREGLVGRIRAHRHLPRELGGLAAAALLLFILLPKQGERAAMPAAESAVLQQLGEMSQVGLVYPRVDRFGAASRTEYRSGAQPGPDADLSQWAERFRRQPSDTTAAFWLAAGHLGQGRLDHADDVLRQALSHTPQANELRHLAAIVAYRRNDLAAASQHLDLLLREYPDDQLAAFNRAVIAIESGRSGDLCAVLDQVTLYTARPALKHRALQLAHEAGCR